MMENIKFYIGPMSKNIVDAIIEFGTKEDKIGLIPSRRQVDYCGGYVNNWTTQQFSSYVKSQNEAVWLQRDHGGPSQGQSMDDGTVSFLDDCKNFDSIHIDPWKKYTNFDEGMLKTVEFMKLLYSKNKNIKFEIGTEEAIRRFEVDEVEKLIVECQRLLPSNICQNIDYIVIQSGVGLDLATMNNTGDFNPERLSKMIDVCKKHNLKTKEHNGDYLTNDQIKQRFELGLDSINIAPEFGQLETLCYFEEMKNTNQFEKLYQICYNSNRWRKWVKSDFNPLTQKEEIIKISGHYILSNPEFLQIKPDIDTKIKSVITNKLREMYEI